jgi:predicted transcriptional regulator
MQRGYSMKTATIPSLRVDPDLRRAVEEVLADGETLSGFVEQSLREGVQRRRLQSEFIARGLRARDNAHQSGHHVSSEAVIDRLETMLSKARAATRS